MRLGRLARRGGRGHPRPVQEPALFVPDGDGYVATLLTQGGWHPDHANGGAVLALLGHCLDDVPALVPMSLSRLTVDLVHPTPLGRRLRVDARIVREGKKIQVVEQVLRAGDDELVRATALRLRDADLSDAGAASSTTDARPADALVPPEQATSHRATPGAPGFLDGIDLRRAATLDGSGWGAWLRLDVPVVAGQAVRATARTTLGFDFANLIGITDHPTTATLINPDVTGHALRAPADGWVAIVGDTRVDARHGRGMSTATLSDADGVFAFVSLSQLIQRR